MSPTRAGIHSLTVAARSGVTFAMAAMRLPRTVSTFSVWRSLREMSDMVRGHSPAPAPPEAKRHAAAMVERQRKDFHFEFTTLKFRPLAEYGEWEGRGRIEPSRIPTY